MEDDSWNFIRELGRKAIHLGSLLLLVVYFFFAEVFNPKMALLILCGLLVIFIELEYFRVETSIKLPLIHRLYVFKRAKEKHQLGGEVFFLIGAILCFAIFDTRIAVAAILMTALGDFTANVFGSRFGKHWISWLNNRAWEGILAEFVVNLSIGFFIVQIAGIPIWPVIIVMAVTATIVETLCDKLDDNMLIPIFSGFFGQVTLIILKSLS